MSRHALAHPAWGTSQDLGDVPPRRPVCPAASVLRLLRVEGLLLEANYRRERRQLAARRKGAPVNGRPHRDGGRISEARSPPWCRSCSTDVGRCGLCAVWTGGCGCRVEERAERLGERVGRTEVPHVGAGQLDQLCVQAGGEPACCLISPVAG
jgi:hypothetical protein